MSPESQRIANGDVGWPASEYRNAGRGRKDRSPTDQPTSSNRSRQ